MRLSLKGMMAASAILWGGAILSVGLINLAAPGYGGAFLQFASSLYPGFHNSRKFLDVLVGTGYALVDAGVGGLLFAWFYNMFAGRSA